MKKQNADRAPARECACEIESEREKERKREGERERELTATNHLATFINIRVQAVLFAFYSNSKTVFRPCVLLEDIHHEVLKEHHPPTMTRLVDICSQNTNTASREDPRSTDERGRNKT